MLENDSMIGYVELAGLIFRIDNGKYDIYVDEQRKQTFKQMVYRGRYDHVSHLGIWALGSDEI